jgi:hypothetical protein
MLARTDAGRGRNSNEISAKPGFGTDHRYLFVNVAIGA